MRGLVLSVAYSWRLVLTVLNSPHRPSSSVSGPSSLVSLPIGLLTLPSICAGPFLSQSLVMVSRFVSFNDALFPVFTLLLGFFVGFYVRDSVVTLGLGPFMILRGLSYATLCSANVCSRVKATETGPLSPLFYKGILSSGLLYRSTGTLPHSALFLSGIIIAALLAL